MVWFLNSQCTHLLKQLHGNKIVCQTQAKRNCKATFIYVCLLEVSDEQKFIQLFSLGDSVVNSGLET